MCLLITLYLSALVQYDAIPRPHLGNMAGWSSYLCSLEGHCQALPAPAVVTLLPDPRLTRFPPCCWG